ncbi:peptidase [Nocardiopsis ansamitocini]|uniref:Peptidase n=1 Tax=Nocardiopsis ansamitocini TaxID=1670832 RepID=A0A9W6UIQ8_9ACTN|nr:peptidase [Nocardiopsis ansamitocini]
MRPLVLRLHFYAGVLVAPFIFVAALSGLLYVWTPQLEEVVHRHELYVPVGDERLPLREQVAAAEEALPAGTLRAVRPGEGPSDTTRVLFDLDGLGESHRQAVFVDPYTGEVRGSLVSYGSSGALPVRTWIDLLHRNLHMGDVGRVYSELAASWMWLIAAGGAALWVARRRRRKRVRGVLLPEPTARGLRRTLSFHGAIGVWALAGLFFLSATGLTWSQFAGENVAGIRAALAWETPSVTAEVPAGSDGPIGVDVGVDRVLESARAFDVDGRVEVVYPVADGATYTVSELDKRWPTSADAVAVDPGTGAVVDEVRFSDYPLMAKFSRWGIDAHMGLLFGVANQVVLTALMLGLLTVMVLGYRMWWQRRPTGRGPALGRAPGRGTWKALPWWLKAIVAVAAVAVGWLMPVLGVSLVLFLVVDALLGRLRFGTVKTD